MSAVLNQMCLPKQVFTLFAGGQSVCLFFEEGSSVSQPFFERKGRFQSFMLTHAGTPLYG